MPKGGLTSETDYIVKKVWYTPPVEEAREDVRTLPVFRTEDFVEDELQVEVDDDIVQELRVVQAVEILIGYYNAAGGRGRRVGEQPVKTTSYWYHVCIDPTSIWHRVDAHDDNMILFWCQCLCS